MPLFDKSQIRPVILESLERYVKEGCPTGGFLRAVLENDLMEAFRLADEGNIAAMFHIVSYVYNEVPISAHGSKQKVQDWLDFWKLKRRREQEEAER